MSSCPAPDRRGEQRLDRRSFLGRAATLASAPPLASLLAACGGGGGMRDGGGRMGRDMPRWMMSGDGMMDGAMREHMRVIRRLLDRHDEISREVEDIDGGIRSRTTSAEPDLAELVQTHVQQMKARLEQGDPIRRMDPLFREIFEHHDQIEMEVEALPSGVLVMETSDDPQVELLIRQHAHAAVSEFVAEGMSRARQPTPLPDGYRS